MTWLHFYVPYLDTQKCVVAWRGASGVACASRYQILLNFPGWADAGKERNILGAGTRHPQNHTTPRGAGVIRENVALVSNAREKYFLL